jgi:hypothetical protein
MKKIFSMFVPALLSMSLLIMSSQVHAGMVATPSLLAPGDSAAQLAQGRQQLTDQLVELGVQRSTALSRVAAMSDQQVSEIRQSIEQLPAGADAGGVILTLFIVFVITDALGATDIFPFVNPIQ